MFFFHLPKQCSPSAFPLRSLWMVGVFNVTAIFLLTITLYFKTVTVAIY